MNSPNRLQQTEDIFHAALERPPAERAAFLAQACGADQQLLTEVNALLAAHERSHNPIDAPVGAVAAQLLADAPLADASTQSPLSRRRDHPFFWLTLLLGIVLCGYYVFAAVEIYRYGTISSVTGYGFRIESGETVITGVQPDGPAAGKLQIGDRVLDLNGDSRARWGLGDSVLRSTQGGMPYTLRIARGASEQTVELRVELRPQQYRQLTMVVCLLILSLLCGLMSIAIGLLKPQELLARLCAFAFISFAFGCMSLALGPAHTFFFGYKDVAFHLLACLSLSPLGQALLYHFYYRFPPGTPAGRFWSGIQYLLYAVTGFTFIVQFPFNLLFVLGAARNDPLSFYDRYRPWIVVTDAFGNWLGDHSLGYLMPSASILAIVAVVIRNYRLVKTPNERRRFKWVSYGSVAGSFPMLFMVLLVLLLILTGRLQSVQDNTVFFFAGVLAILAMVLLPLSLGYAIVNHRVFDISFVVRRGVQYLFAKNVLRFLLALPVIGLTLTTYANRDRTLGDLLFRNSVWFYLLLLVTITLGLAYRRNLRERLDRRFFREAYHQDQVLRELIEQVRQLDSMGEVARLVSQKVDAALHPERLYLFYREEGRNDLALGYSSGGASRDLRIHAEFELLRFMEYQGGAQDFPFPAKTKLPPSEKEWLTRLGTNLIVPMNGTDNRLAGLLLLGSKKSEIPYSGSDRQLLETLADQIALVYENARLKERVAKDRKVQHEVLARVEAQHLNLLKECPACGACYDSATRLCAKDRTELALTLPVERTLEGKYRLEQLLGKGGMGAVYAATDLRLGRRVAVKVLTGSLFGDQAALRRFEREARASARLNHPNIIAVHDYGRAGAEGAYLVMELITGVTLRDELKAAGTLAPAIIADWFAQIFAGVQAAHEAGVIHRDLKPENVLLTKLEDGRREIKLLDFGLAKLTERRGDGVTGRLGDANSPSSSIPQSPGLTQPGMVMGTFGYMSPEQLLGEEVDERSDIFALGVLVIEALTGQRPFQGKSYAELLTAVLQQPFHLPGEAPPFQRLNAALQQCLAKDRRQRYATVAVLQHELIPILKACPPFGQPLGSLEEPSGEADTAMLPGK